MPKQKEGNVKEPRLGYGAAAAVVVTLAIYFGAQLLAGIIIALYLSIRSIDLSEAAGLLEDSVTGQFAFIVLLEALSIYLLWLFLKSRQITWSDIGLKKPSLKNLLYAIPTFVAYFVILITVMVLVSKLVPGLNTDQDQQIGFDAASGSGQLSLVFVSLVLLPALVEEILVRGFLYGGLIKKFSKLVAALIASTIFAIAHLQFGSGEPLLWVAAIDTFILSMVLIWLREKTGNIWAGVIVHMIKNSLAFVSLFILELN